MLDSAPTRTSYLSSHSTSSNSPRNQYALSTIRNAIASDSQRIRVQDESTGKSYELQLGKETPYPQNFGGDDSEDISVGDIPPQDKAGSSSAKGDLPASPVAPTANGKSNATATPPLASGSTAPGAKSTANGHGSSHRMLRLPMLVKSRASAAAGNDAKESSGKESPKPVAVADGPSKSDNQAPASTSADGQAASADSKPIPKPTRRTSDLLRGPPKGPIRQGSTSSVGELHLQELNKRYHETLAVNQSNEALRKTVSRDSSVRSSRDKQRIRTGSTSRSSLVPQNAGEGSSISQQYTAPTRHYPVMSELPPSPPLETDLEAGKKALPSDADKTPIDRRTANNRAAHLTVDSSAGRPRYSDKRMPSASSVASSAYHSAEEDFVDAPEDVAGKTSPRTPTQRNPMAGVLHSSPEQSEPLRLPPDARGSEEISPRTSLPPTFYLQRTTSDDSHQTSKAQAAPDLTRTFSSNAYLQPPAGSNQPASPSRRHRSLPPREKSAERNTTGSSTQSSESAASGGVVRRSSREKWQDQNQADVSTFGTSSSTGAIASNASTTSKGPTAGTLRTGDAGFDEEVAKAEALIRKRKERTRREEEEKAAATAEVGKKEAEQRDQQLRDRERQRSSTIGGGAGGVAGMPALMRAKSGLGRAGTGGPTTLSAAGQAAQAAKDAEEHKPAATIGNIINEGHVNYVLMYNMLTGIRIGVSRCQTRLKRPLRDEDYRAKHKFTFDIIGNELTPTAKYDFKFKDYAPWVFRELREYFHLDPADYLLSLTSKYILSELGSPGKSGSFFYFSRDYRFIIKTIRHGEHKFLRKILKDYHEHVKANPHTLLSRFYGLHRVKLPHGKKIHFVIMNNLFPPHRDIHETYDLKGSSLGREYPEEKAKTKKGATLKDLNWVRRRRELEFGPEKKSLFEAQLENDVALLKKLNIMDYSLLIGLHDVRRGNRENLRAEKLQVVQPEEVGNGQGGQSATNAATSSNPPAPGSPASASASNHHHPHVPHLSLPHHHHERATSPSSQGGMSRSESGFTVLSDEDFVAAELGPASPLPGSTESNPLSPGAMQSSSTSALPSSSLPTSSSNPTNINSPTTAGGSSSTNPKRASEVNAFVLRAAVRRSDLQALGSSSTAQLPAKETSERRHFLFYQEEGGFRSTNDLNEPTDWIYYLGIIDLFTPYSTIKRGENWWKRLTLHDGRMVSSVPPRQYGDRFIQFLEAVVRPMEWKNLPPGFEKMRKEEPLIPIGIGAGAIEDEEKRGQEVKVNESKVEELSMPVAATTEQGINEKVG